MRVSFETGSGGTQRPGWGTIAAILFVTAMVAMFITALVVVILGHRTLAGDLAIIMFLLAFVCIPAWVAYALGRRITKREFDEVRSTAATKREFDAIMQAVSGLHERLDSDGTVRQFPQRGRDNG